MDGKSTNGIAVFTAVDGTLLDARTFEPGRSRRTVEQLRHAGAPVVPVTVMTLDEIAPIASELGLQHAMIVEAGGAIARATTTGWEVEQYGPDAEALLDVVLQIEDRSGARLLVYSVLPESDASRLSGRSGEMLRHSIHRRFSEPFVIESGSVEAVRRAAESIGFSVKRGKRFFYLCRACDEGEAFMRVREELRCDIAIGVGGSPLDAEFLTRADLPIIVPGESGEPDAELLARVPNARIAPAPGPRGWAAAVNDVWQELVRARPARHA